MDAETIISLTVEVLKEKLRELNLSTVGRKKELQDIHLGHFGFNSEQSEEISGDESTHSVYADAGVDGVHARGKVVFTLRDIEGSISSFSGDSSYDVNQWVSEFDDVADTVGWNNLQEYVYAKQLLKGAAKHFTRGLVGVRDWVSLKKELIEEFGEKLCGSEIHRALRNRKKQP